MVMNLPHHSSLDDFLANLFGSESRVKQYKIHQGHRSRVYKIPFGNHFVVVKTSNRIPLYHFMRGKILRNASIGKFCFGDPLMFAELEKHREVEYAKLVLLNELGFLAPRLYQTNVDGLLVMEYLGDTTLHRVLNDSDIEHQRKVEIVAAGAYQLYMLHDQTGVFHGDPGTSNGIFTPEGKFVWIDYETILDTTKKPTEWFFGRDVRIYAYSVCLSANGLEERRDYIDAIIDSYPQKEVLVWAAKQINQGRILWLLQLRDLAFYGRYYPTPLYLILSSIGNRSSI